VYLESWLGCLNGKVKVIKISCHDASRAMAHPFVCEMRWNFARTTVPLSSQRHAKLQSGCLASVFACGLSNFYFLNKFQQKLQFSSGQCHDVYLHTVAS
jgi:hypothetical protein